VYTMLTENMDEEEKIDFDALLFADSETNFGAVSKKADRIMFASRLGGM
jgi:hypothetical protein